MINYLQFNLIVLRNNISECKWINNVFVFNLKIDKVGQCMYFGQIGSWTLYTIDTNDHPLCHIRLFIAAH